MTTDLARGGILGHLKCIWQHLEKLEHMLLIPSKEYELETERI